MLKRWLLLAAAVVLVPAPASAASNDMFRGKTITYIVATTAGGGYDTYGRMIARYMPKYLPGARIIVRNVPGAGNIIGANAIYTARPDGTTIGMFNTGLIYNQLIGSAGMNFDIAKFTWLGKAATEARAVVLSTNSGIKSFDDMLKARDVKFATSGVGTASYFDTRILADALKLNIQVVNNFTGNTGELSMRRGEVAGQIGTVESLEQFVKAGGGFYALEISGSQAKLPACRTWRSTPRTSARRSSWRCCRRCPSSDGCRQHLRAFPPKRSRSCAPRWSRRSRIPASSPIPRS